MEVQNSKGSHSKLEAQCASPGRSSPPTFTLGMEWESAGAQMGVLFKIPPLGLPQPLAPYLCRDKKGSRHSCAAGVQERGSTHPLGP